MMCFLIYSSDGYDLFSLSLYAVAITPSAIGHSPLTCTWIVLSTTCYTLCSSEHTKKDKPRREGGREIVYYCLMCNWMRAANTKSNWSVEIERFERKTSSSIDVWTNQRYFARIRFYCGSNFFSVFIVVVVVVSTIPRTHIKYILFLFRLRWQWPLFVDGFAFSERGQSAIIVIVRQRRQQLQRHPLPLRWTDR